MKLPTLRALTARLRELHAAWSHPDAGGEYVSLCYHEDGYWTAHNYANDVSADGKSYGREYIPGDGAKFDAVAAARRLLAAARDAT